MHTLLDLRGSIPTFIHISDGTWHDSNLLDYLDFEPNAIYTMDKAYVDLAALDKMNTIGAYFVTRARAIMRYRVIEDRTCYEDGIHTDRLVVFTGYKSSHLYPNALRMVEYYDVETNETLIFISNNMDISALDIANIYRNRYPQMYAHCILGVTPHSFNGHILLDPLEKHLYLPAITIDVCDI